MRRHLAFAGRVPPREMQLWDVGANPTDYGVHLWTDRSIAEVGGTYDERGNPLVIDLEHNIGKGPEVPDPLAPTGGYARLDIRGGAPWLVFEWSAIAEEQIVTGQRRYLSPEYDTDAATGEIVCLRRVSLVAAPGTHHARVLASAKKETPMDPIMIAALRAACSSGDIASVEALLAELEKAGGTPGAESPAEGDVAAAGEGGDKPKPYAEGSGGGEEKPKPADAVAASEAAAEEPVAAGEAPKPIAAGAAVRPPPPAMPRPAKVAPVVTKVVQAAAAQGPSAQDAIDRADDLERDMLLRAEGERLIEPIRIWASSQPLKVVKGLIDAAPKRLASTPMVTGTRGGQLGPTGTPVKRHLTGEARRSYEQAMGVTKPTVIGPSYSPEGYLRLSAGCPGEYRAQEARDNAGK